MTKSPFKVLVDGAEHIVHGGIGRIIGRELKIEGRRRAELPEEIKPFLKVDENYRQRFHVFRVPLAEHTPWIETLQNAAVSGRDLSIDEKYFGKGGYLVGKGVEELSLPIVPGELYRMHYVGRENGSGDQRIFDAQSRYTTDEERGFGSQKAYTLAGSFALQEILYLGLLHIGIKLHELPRAVGKEFGIAVDEQALREGATIDTVIGFIFGHRKNRGAFHTNPNGIPIEELSSEKLREAKARIIEYLNK